MAKIGVANLSRCPGVTCWFVGKLGLLRVCFVDLSISLNLR